MLSNRINYALELLKEDTLSNRNDIIIFSFSNPHNNFVSLTLLNQ